MSELFKILPDLVETAAKTWLGTVTLTIVALSILAYVFFAKDSPKIRVEIFSLFFAGAAVLTWAVMQAEPQSRASPTIAPDDPEQVLESSSEVDNSAATAIPAKPHLAGKTIGVYYPYGDLKAKRTGSRFTTGLSQVEATTAFYSIGGPFRKPQAPDISLVVVTPEVALSETAVRMTLEKIVGRRFRSKSRFEKSKPSPAKHGP